MKENENLNQANTNIYIMRHGERIDNTFNDWMSVCVTKDGEYIRTDSNMPVELPKRQGAMESFRFDSPLTNIGAFEARLIGESFALANVKIRFIYSSPALRCVQTCHNVISGSGLNNIPIKIEPGLFEWVSFYADMYPEFMTQEEFVNAGYSVDKNYEPFIILNQLKNMLNETCDEYYERGFKVMNKIIKEVNEKGGGNVLVVAHGSSLDICSRQITGLKPRNVDEISRIIDEIPYCGLIRLQLQNNKIKMVRSDILNISHSSNKRFDFNVLNNIH